MRFSQIIEAQHSEPSWRYDQGGASFGMAVTARTVSGSFKVKDEKSVTGEWPYGYSFVFARNGEVEISFYLDTANYYSRDVFLAAEEGKISHEEAKELSYRQMRDGMGLYNEMGPNVARTVLRIMGGLIQKFIAEYDPPILMMVAKTDRRMTLYERMLRQLPGYRISHEPDPRGDGHIVYARKENAVTEAVEAAAPATGKVVSGGELLALYGGREMSYDDLPEPYQKSLTQWMVVEGENEEYQEQSYGVVEVPMSDILQIIYDQLGEGQTFYEFWGNGTSGYGPAYSERWPIIWSDGWEDGMHRLFTYRARGETMVPVVVV